MKNATLLSLSSLILFAGTVLSASLDVDPELSRIQVDASATGHKFTGTLKKFTAKVSGKAASLSPSSFDLKWSFQDLDTDDAKRDKEMVKWLGGGDPKGSFAFTKSWTDKAGKTHGMGTLTIHGVSKTVSFPYTVKKEGNLVTIDGTASLDYQNFSLPIVRSMAVMTVDPKLTVRFHVVGKVK
jgi:polyisoprenoid-binding protein YceI